MLIGARDSASPPQKCMAAGECRLLRNKKGANNFGEQASWAENRVPQPRDVTSRAPELGITAWAATFAPDFSFTPTSHTRIKYENSPPFSRHPKRLHHRQPPRPRRRCHHRPRKRLYDGLRVRHRHPRLAPRHAFQLPHLSPRPQTLRDHRA